MQRSALPRILFHCRWTVKVVVVEGGIGEDLYLFVESQQHAETNTAPLLYDITRIRHSRQYVSFLGWTNMCIMIIAVHWGGLLRESKGFWLSMEGLPCWVGLGCTC